MHTCGTGLHVAVKRDDVIGEGAVGLPVVLLESGSYVVQVFVRPDVRVRMGALHPELELLPSLRPCGVILQPIRKRNRKSLLSST